MTEDDIRALLASAADGDQLAWNRLVDRHQGLVWSIARGFGLADADCADAVQNTWLRLVENLARIREPEHLGSWLATTTRHECLRLLRRRAREVPASDDLPDPPDASAAVDQTLLLDERDAALWTALDALSDRCRRLLRILMAASSYLEVSAALDIPVGSIGPTRQRCLAQLRRIVAVDPVLGTLEPQ